MKNAGADVFTQLCRDADAAAQLHKPPAYWLIVAQPGPPPPQTQHFRFTADLSSLQDYLRRSSFPVLHPQSLLAKNPSPFPHSLAPCTSTGIEHHYNIWILKLHALIHMWKTDYDLCLSHNISLGSLEL